MTCEEILLNNLSVHDLKALYLYLESVSFRCTDDDTKEIIANFMEAIKTRISDKLNEDWPEVTNVGN